MYSKTIKKIKDYLDNAVTTEDNIRLLNDEYLAHSNIHSNQTDVEIMERLLNKNKRADGVFYSEQEQWEIVNYVLYNSASKIASNLDVTKNGQNFAIEFDYDEIIGHGFLKDDNGFIRPFESKYVTVVLQKDESKPLGFRVQTSFPGQLNSSIDMLNIDKNVNVFDIVKETNYYKNASPIEKTLLEYQSSDKPYPAKLLRYNEIEGIQLKQRVRENGIVSTKKENNIFISESSSSIVRREDISLDSDEKPHWINGPLKIATQFYNKESSKLNLNDKGALEYVKNSGKSGELLALTITAIKSTLTKNLKLEKTTTKHIEKEGISI